MRMRSPSSGCLTTRPTKSPRIRFRLLLRHFMAAGQGGGEMLQGNGCLLWRLPFAIETSFFMANNADIGRDAASHKRFW